jgi:predicted AlkP superfamily pyrophosphatase or phosphodiesterase
VAPSRNEHDAQVEGSSQRRDAILGLRFPTVGELEGEPAEGIGEDRHEPKSSHHRTIASRSRTGHRPDLSFRRMRKPTAALVVVLTSTLGVLAATRPPPPPLVVISIDGLPPDYVLDADAHGLRIPHLRRLLADGAHATGVAGVLPTITYPSHTTLVTGVSPGRHGIVANTTFDPLGRNRDGWYWYAEDIKVPTLWDAAGRAGMVTSNVDWPVTVGARITYNIAQYWRTDVPDAPDDAKLGRALSTPGLIAEVESSVGPYPSGYAYGVPEDRRRAAFNAHLLRTKRPRLHLCYFSGLDEEQHRGGPMSLATWAALEELDGLVGQVRAAAEEGGGGKAVVAVVSDHGFTRTTRELELGEALREAQVYDRGKAPWKVSVWNCGGSAAIVLKDPADDETRTAVALVLRRLAEAPDSPIDRVLVGSDARLAGGFPGAAFVVGVKPDTRIGAAMDGGPIVRVVPLSGTHGFLAAHREMDGAFLIAGPHIPAGRDLGRIDMRDVAPTLAGVLGVSLPAAEGRDLLN